MNNTKILVIGACGQIGTELLVALRKRNGHDNVIATDIHYRENVSPEIAPYYKLDVLNTDALEALIVDLEITQIYHLAAVLSAKGESNPTLAWDLNMNSLLSVLDLSVKHKISKVFWPSSIAVFGPDSVKENCPQQGVTEPSTVYGISKAAGEQWCKYYFEKYGLDVRSLRYPGLISYTGAPGGGTTDYAVDIFHHAIKGESYTCFLNEQTALPMMFMQDAINATLQLMDAPYKGIKVRTAYNLSALSFTPEELEKEIKSLIPEFSVSYAPDFRQAIADSWPASIDDSAARRDWGWKPSYNLKAMVREMLENLWVLQAE
ncbi:NAD-dependent epimerase/dehydratase family protein [Pedobacter sp. UBA5917]|jgi:nucleoside-diphosphate-sugar epimerase|uniref:NAD-dependent epimerase/dehydratase family protein n=1 Tax=Pedobacter sp. UBA5917 TaxID=1947061 RepID=UPI0025E8B17F|nr:NAD-dependent epimerase/dehydratase family protein [Pedobacter sp. UBA5917]